MTVDEIVKKRRDLEKRLRIDIAQFELDTGVQVEHIEPVHVTRLGDRQDTLIEVIVKLEFPR